MLKTREISTRENAHKIKLQEKHSWSIQKLSDKEFITSLIKNIEYKGVLNLRICPPVGLKRLFTDFNNHNEDEQVAINCDYYDASTRIPNSNKPNHSIFHINIASLGLHKEELEAAISLTNVEFDIITISETKIIKNTDPNYDITLPGYKDLYSTPTESHKGVFLVHVKEIDKQK